ncbi:MAG: T9SS type A sorting domain-containing protein, partial [Flavobacteriales bacterium]|nr:T9SS type A sorting domain-containing protein [Flavobacteriales bacterium]
GCISNVVNDTIYMTYQRDVYPGLNIQGDEDPITKNSIVFMTIPVEGFETLATKEITNSTSNLSIYPNPASNRININLGNNKEIAKVTITNILGKVVKTTTMNGESTQLSIEELINGIYFVSVETTNQVTTKSLVKK